MLSEDVRKMSKPAAEQAAAASARALADRKELALVAVERTRMPMVVTDPRQDDNPIVLANQSFLDLSGYSAAEVIGRNCRFLQGPRTDRRAVAKVRDAIEAEREITIELLNYRKDGSCFWNELFISPVRDDEGHLLYFFASSKDISKRRQAQDLEAEEYRLLKEVDHRAKNALALVQGIVRLSSAENPEAYAVAVQGRVESLARAHSLLASARWRDVPLALVIQGEAEPYRRQPVAVEGPPVTIAAEQVQPLALVLHEMFSNAYQHGALSRKGGSVRICWRLEESGQKIVVDWQESGGPAPEPDPKAGFGSMLIRTTIERQLGGGVDLRWNATGLEGQLELPAICPDPEP